MSPLGAILPGLQEAGGTPSETGPALAAVLAAGLWAYGCLLFQRVLSSGPGAPSAAAANLFKNVLAGVVCCALWALLGSSLPIDERLPGLLFSGLLGFAVGDTLYFAAIPRCGLHTAAMFGNLIPPVAALLAWLRLGERLAPVTLVWMAVVLLGIVFVLTDPARRGEPGQPHGRRWVHGVLLAAGAALCQSEAIVEGRSSMQGTELLPAIEVFPATVARIAAGVAGGVLLALAIGLGGRLRGTGRGPRAELAILLRPFADRTHWLPMLRAALFASILTLPLWSYSVAGSRSGISSVLLATTPLFTLPMARWCGERYGLRTVLGTALGFGGAAGLVLTL